ncbi:hypothetical protein J4N02_03440 [Propioniciclava sp. MC1595]|uniref:hypothetical protein n=1 Tax=Propioniciclava sp. MC1595 TaxID=2760308 RepID=UPI001AA1BEDD|nr:hypothetical protein [Propioniciclava sp. MC1595]QTE26683.1 hypothetical protein J4N02_03440 [Propioniciclava sp. MC1595]
MREDYSADGDAWSYLPHDHARSRAYRWGEDGLAGMCDSEQLSCLALALWNGRDPILKERMFGLTGPQGNHGEDVKEYWWFLDAVPSHSWLRWRYHYPQAEFPYQDLVTENGRRDRDQPEYELLDTGVFDDDRYWVVDVAYAKAGPHDVLMEISLTNAGPDSARIHVLPHLWFRNTWSSEAGAKPPALRQSAPDQVTIEHPRFGDLRWELDLAGLSARHRLLLPLRRRAVVSSLVRSLGGRPVPRSSPAVGATERSPRIGGAIPDSPRIPHGKVTKWQSICISPCQGVVIG